MDKHVTAVIGAGLYGLQLEIAVFWANENGNRRCPGRYVLQPHRTRKDASFDARSFARPLDVVRKDLFQGFDRTWRTAMIERLADMLDGPRCRLFHQANVQIPVVRTVTFRAPAAESQYATTLQSHQAANIIEGKEHIRIEVRFDGGIASRPIPINAIFIRIEHLAMGAFIQAFDYFEEGARMQLVVLIKRRDEIAFSLLQSLVLRFGATPCAHADLPVRILLLVDGLNGTLKKKGIRVVGWQNDGN
jgi:hypothetical protein